MSSLNVSIYNIELNIFSGEEFTLCLQSGFQQWWQLLLQNIFSQDEAKGSECIKNFVRSIIIYKLVLFIIKLVKGAFMFMRNISNVIGCLLPIKYQIVKDKRFLM